MEKAITDMKKAPAFCVFGGATTATGDFGGELIMPDYYPEIRKIVTVKATVLPDSRYIHDNELEAGGTLCFSVLYIGDDQTLAGVPYVTEYSQTVSVPEGGISPELITVESTCENVSARPLGPRKISLRARVKSRITWDRYEPYQPTVTGPDKTTLDPQRRRSIEKLEVNAESVEKKLYQMTGSVKGELETEGIMKPVVCFGDILIGEVKAENRMLNVKGEVALSTVVQSADGTYGTYCHSIPFEERIDGETVTKDTASCVMGRLAHVSAALDDDGKTLCFEAEYDLDAHTARECRMVYTEDIYSREYELSDQRRKIKNQSLLCCADTILPVTAEGKRKKQGSNNELLIFCTAEPAVERVDASGKSAVVTGSCRFSAYIAADGEIVTEEFSVPCSAEMPFLGEKDVKDIAFHAKAAASGCTCTVQEQRLKAECRLSVSLAAFCVEELEPVWEADVGNMTKALSEDCVIRVCYPEEGKRIWDIAKEYKVSVPLCEKLNQKSRTDISDGSPIIIK